MLRLDGDFRTGPLSKKEAAILWFLIGAACVVLFWIINGRFDNDRIMQSPDVTTIQEKWDCQPEEIVSFGPEGVTCISEEEHVEARKVQAGDTTAPVPYNN